MEQAVIAALLLVGLVIGVGVGAAYARAKRGWSDYRTIRNSVPGARRTAWLAVRAVLTKVGVIALLLVGAAAYAAAGSDHDRADPGPTPTATVTPTPSPRPRR
ncbi:MULTISPECIES: hypothetical protein [Micromonospora]|uniref:Uncharacterized protein n=1 Tax=Micromonospora solifontis TaxID=2487138 RepID=A0ABX9WJE1_9ACTN|nr:MULTISPECIES: hypothetical protein [Micromonospora]NES14058.1 hypothetical protein [Micromonospora sp. PPF5-17B]NES35688.1 hypothetical protein [Micromonospora solifontis]NES56065.1 hypothetical protein [Micromonospora sp. PPF5-6]RNM00369.1 hypothetical protein EFE23_05850 [Micromonospora solifontis]